MNWEMNERISLSSGSSIGLAVRPDSRKGIEFSENRRRETEGRAKINECPERNREAKSSLLSKPTLELMNVSGFPVNIDRKYRGAIEIDKADGNVLKSDSKYEIGIPSSATRKQKRQDTLRKDNINTTRRWTEDKPGNSIAKRLELIHELNQKILANYERFQHRSKRVKDAKEQAKNCAKGRTDVEEHIYAEIKRKNKTTCRTSDRKNQNILKQDIPGRDTCKKKDLPSLRQGNNLSKSSLSKKCYDKISSEDRVEKKDASRVTNKSDRRIVCENTNFSMAAKENVSCRVNERSLLSIHSKNSKEQLVEESSIFYGSEDANQIELNTEDYLESSKLYPENCVLCNNEPKDERTKENARDNASEIDRSDSRKDDAGSTPRNGRDLSVMDEKILESEILEKLDETIDRFDSEKTQPTSGDISNEDGSFSTDSIQSRSPSSAKGLKDANLPDTFNSSWDSGVGVDVGNGSGWVRIHTGIESSLVYLTLDTTAKDVCRDMLLGDDLSLFVQVNVFSCLIVLSTLRNSALASRDNEH